MKARCWLVAAAVSSLLPAAARADGLAGRFTMAVQVGTQSEVSGNMIQSTAGTLLDRPITLDSLRYRDIYAPEWRLQGLIGYGVGTRTEVIARATWYKSTAVEGVEVGTLNGEQLFAYFPSQDDPADYEEVGFEVGFRYYLATQSRLKSYIAPVLGVRFINESLISLSAPAAGSSIQNVPFSQESTVPVFGLDIGFTFDLGERFYVGMDTGIRLPVPARLLRVPAHPSPAWTRATGAGPHRSRRSSGFGSSETPPRGVWGVPRTPQNKERWQQAGAFAPLYPRLLESHEDSGGSMTNEKATKTGQPGGAPKPPPRPRALRNLDFAVQIDRLKAS